jgi:hypothetical protein
VSGDRRPVLFLPVEVKVREFRAKLLIAGLAARAGFRVYIGSKTAVRNAMLSRPQRSGVFFGKGGDRFAVLDEVKRHCEWLVVQDEEIGPGMTVPEVERSFRSRFGEDVAALVDELYLFSELPPSGARAGPPGASRSVGGDGLAASGPVARAAARSGRGRWRRGSVTATATSCCSRRTSR